MAALGEALAAGGFIFGAVSVADFAVYPKLAGATVDAPVADWLQRMWRRPATGRGMTAVAG